MDVGGGMWMWRVQVDELRARQLPTAYHPNSPLSIIAGLPDKSTCPTSL